MASKHDSKKNRTGTITVEMDEKEYITLINGYKAQLDKNMATIDSLQQVNLELKKQIEALKNSLVHPEVVENIKHQARQQINAEIKAREKLTEELAVQIKTLARREEGLRNALGKWQKKITGEDIRPPKHIRQKGFTYEFRGTPKKKVKVYFIEIILPVPYETDYPDLEKYAIAEIRDDMNLKKITFSQGKWIATYQSLKPV